LRDDRAERERRAVVGRHLAERIVSLERAQCRIPGQVIAERARVGIDEQLVGIAAQALRRVPRTVDAIAVSRARPDLWQVDVPDLTDALLEIDRLLVAVGVEAELDALGHA